MGIPALYTAATGMQALQTKLDTIANNMANVNTTAFKRDRCNFEDLFYRQYKLPGALDQLGNPTPVGIHVGLGTRVQSVQSDFDQGTLNQTNGQLDLAIVGDGFFQLTDPGTGQIVYTRSGNFSRNANGSIVMGSANIGRELNPSITIPPDATGISVGADGQVFVLQAGTTNQTLVGNIQLVKFIDPQGLLKLGENLYQQTDASGQPIIATPGTQGIGTIRQGALETSNVDPVSELVDLITTQRAFELNSQVVQAGDQVLQLIANLRRV